MMHASFKETLWKQFGAAIDMLENAVKACPDAQWDATDKFWHKAFHTVFFLDYYLDTEPGQFRPPHPFGLSEFDPAGRMPERTYTKKEILEYVAFCRKKCHDLIAELNEERLAARWINSWRNYSRFEILIYNMRHVQHHAAQLNLLLRQQTNASPEWVSQTNVDL
ncbi:MAG TPA: DinB family protein [Bacteroidia bacterium]|nr:DinB family protein [Bacteroidia bacterium]